MLKIKEACCKRMWIEIDKFKKKEISPKYGTYLSTIWYEEQTRTYHLLSMKFPDCCGGIPIAFCPFCGAKLPPPLDPEDTIMKEYGEDYVRYNFEPEYKSLPKKIRKEFDTDKWWKKRGL
ncbi:MAG: hypothetical protein IJA14_03340 [Alphaproteobacteria bacterium]|nr:hypothetical protein [Alphaproteobacteria bacterium]